MTKLITSITLLICSIIFSQNTISHYPVIQWQKKIGDNISGTAKSVKETLDGGYIVLGEASLGNQENSNPYGGYDIWILKLNNSGTVKWKKILGGAKDDYANSIQQTTDGGYIISGTTNSNNGDVINKKEENGYDYWIIKLDINGNLQWQKVFGGDGADLANNVQQTADGGFIVGGTTRSNFENIERDLFEGFNDENWILKLDRIGNIEWENVFGGPGYDKPNSIQQTKDKGYIIAGYANNNFSLSSSDYDFNLVKVNEKGVVEWQKKYGGTNHDVAYSLQQTQDNGYIMAGTTESVDGDVTNIRGGGKDFWVIKLNAAGELLWQKAFGETAKDEAKSIEQTPDGGYIMAGFVGVDDIDGIVVKLDKNGVLEWQKRIGGSAFDGFENIQITKDHGYILAGITFSYDGDLQDICEENTTLWVLKLSLQDEIINKKY